MLRPKQMLGCLVAVLLLTAGIRGAALSRKPIEYGRVLRQWVDDRPSGQVYWLEFYQPEPDTPSGQRGPWSAMVSPSDYQRLRVGDDFYYVRRGPTRITLQRR